MPSRTHEQTINISLGEVLQTMGADWLVRAEEVGGTFETGGRPDVLVERPGEWPVVIEAEVGNYRQAEIEAQSRLGKRLIGSTSKIDTAIALVYPRELRSLHGENLRTRLRATKFEYALYSAQEDGTTTRLPTSGFISGGVRELALLLHRSGVPTWRADALTDTLEHGIKGAEGDFRSKHPIGSRCGAAIAKVLGQSDDEDGQTRKMAMAVVVNALVFHAALAEAEMLVSESNGDQRATKSPGEFRDLGNFIPSPLLDEWKRILGVNYWPIFHTAKEILRCLPVASQVQTLNGLWDTAEKLVAGGVTKSHDLTGVIFQRLIADRKFLATFYTRPACAALLASLAMPHQKPLRHENWSDAKSLIRTRIGDFACGTGTLLSTAYQRLGLLHEVHGGNSKTLHPAMMKDGLVGLDVLNVAVHLTAAMLAGSNPDTPFEGECLLTMPYGADQDWGVSLGSLDLLSEQPSFEFFKKAALTAGGSGEQQVKDILRHVGHGHFDLVIMNPPFTRHGAREGERTETHNPAFAAFNTTEEDQDKLAQHLKVLGAGGCGHGHAGLASYFVDLADRKLASGGTMALVLPLSAMSGLSWDEVRNLWRKGYANILVVTIAEKSDDTKSFSADTGMAECLFVATKTTSGMQNNRAIFVILDRRPDSVLEGEVMADAISHEVLVGSIRKLEDGPFGGSRVSLGETKIAEILDCPLPTTGAWQMVGISDFSLGQTAFQLGNGRLWIEGMSGSSVINLPVAAIGEVSSRMGPHDLDISGATIKSDGLPQGPFKIHRGSPAGASYPCLWNHDTEKERCLLVEPDSHGQIRAVRGGVPDALQARAASRWATATRAHYNRDLRFNAQSLTVAMTEQPSIGGRAWPSVVLENREQEFAFALWCNSTLGLLCHWWMSNKTQAGRGCVTVTSIPLIPTLNLRVLRKVQHNAATKAFRALAGNRLLPFDQIHEDLARAEIDRALLVDVLGLDPALCEDRGPLAGLRAKLAAEPQIHGNKGTRVVFTGTGEDSAAIDVD
jgi:hypothetical protein